MQFVIRDGSRTLRNTITTSILIAFSCVQGCGTTTGPLSSEETQILSSASASGSLIWWSKFDGILVVEVDGTDLVPDQDATTIDAWLGAIHSLERRGYISNEGMKIGIHEVTDSGHLVANRISAADM